KNMAATEFIYPSPGIESKPNRFIAAIDSEKPDDCGKAAENAVREKFSHIADAVFQKKFRNTSKPADYDDQIEKFLQINWLILPYQPDNYGEVYEKLERLLGAIKNVRAFDQFAETGRKCSIDGERNVKVYRRAVNEKNNKPDLLFKKKLFTDDLIAVDYGDTAYLKPKDLHPGEGLSAVSFTKRCFSSVKPEYSDEKGFPSTAEIALMNMLHKLEQSGTGKECLDKYRSLYKSHHFDAQFYYSENLTPDYFKKNGLAGLIPHLREILKMCRTIELAAEKERLKLKKYYAIVIFDGDSMGEWLSGGKLAEQTRLRAFHESLSRCLGKFAKQAKDCLTPPKGKAVYAGGDDFLGFVSLDSLFDVLSELRKEFDNQVSIPVSKEFALKKGNERLTFSAGIAVAHYKTPLSAALNWAWKMKKQAKEMDDRKDAFAIAVLKRSGETDKTVYKWEKGTWLSVFDSMLEQFRNDHFSSKFIYNMDREFRRMTDPDGKLSICPDMVTAEIKRLTGRACKMKTDDKESMIKEMTENTNTLYLKSPRSFENFLSALNIIDFLERKATK
ncbi:MAG: type III-B CRISPR-associated protein Cas10/Cmr2, partial [Desulfobacteraceae bacterium]|nr:type III-B CRISPR-associated protein Cas10/Cmr2 [Desulfobacteraceae bacterium]